MPKITDGRKILGVTSGAFKNYFKGKGWKIVFDTEEPEVIETSDNEIDDTPVLGEIPDENDVVTDEAELQEETAELPEEIAAYLTKNGLTKEELLEIPVNDMTDEELDAATVALSLDIPEGTSKNKIKKAINEALKG